MQGLLALLGAVLCVLPRVLGKAIDNGLVPVPILRPVTVGNSNRECERGDIDLMFIIDGSSSIKENDFKRVQNFLAKTVRSLSGSNPASLRVAAVQFSGNPNTEFSFDTFAGSGEAEDYFLNRLRHKQGVTNTGKALTYALKNELRVVIFTDGLATDKLDEPAAKFHAGLPTGTNVVVVGVGKTLDDKQLFTIAEGRAPTEAQLADTDGDDWEDVIQVEDFSQLEDTIQSLASKAGCIVRPATTTLQDSGETGIHLECGPEGITVGSPTQKAFEGRVYAKDHFDDDECFVQGDGVTAYAGNLTFGLSSCGTKRHRQFADEAAGTPAGVTLEATVIFQFHKDVQTKIDVPYKIKCFYMDAQKQVNTDINVSPPTTLAQQFDLPMPVCSYKVIENYPNGEEVRFAVVGDKITHVWECVSDYPDTFKMRVHDCYIEANGNKQPLLDTAGCEIDDILVQTPSYEDTNLKAWVDTHVFKFADEPVVSFECQVSICVSLDTEDGDEDLCPGYPPLCGAQAPAILEPEPTTEAPPRFGRRGRGRGRRSAPLNRQFFTFTHPVTYKNEKTMDIGTPEIYVADQSDIGKRGQFFTFTHPVTYKNEKTMDIGTPEIYVADQSDIGKRGQFFTFTHPVTYKNEKTMDIGTPEIYVADQSDIGKRGQFFTFTHPVTYKNEKTMDIGTPEIYVADQSDIGKRGQFFTFTHPVTYKNEKTMDIGTPEIYVADQSDIGKRGQFFTFTHPVTYKNEKTMDIGTPEIYVADQSDIGKRGQFFTFTHPVTYKNEKTMDIGTPEIYVADQSDIGKRGQFFTFTHPVTYKNEKTMDIGTPEIYVADQSDIGKRGQFFTFTHPVTYKNEKTMDIGTPEIYVADQSDIDYEALAHRRLGDENKSSSKSKRVCLTHMEVAMFGVFTFGGFVLTAAVSVAFHMRSPKRS